MNTKEYEKAKQECWDTLWDSLLRDKDVEDFPTAKDVCDFAFDHAYRLGMEAAKKEQQSEPKYHVGENVSVHYPTGKRIGFIKEVLLDSSYDVDFGGGCTGHGISEYLIEPYTEPQEDKHFDNIIKYGFRDERRLNIATQILCAIIPKFENGDIGLTMSDEHDIMQVACRLANMLISESEKAEYNDTDSD